MDFIFLLINLFVFIFGLCVGSFLNCVIYRLALPNFSFWKNLGGQSRSFCPDCKHQLSWKDLAPVFSFLFLRGKCRYCRSKISIQYPLVEISTGLIFLLILSQFQTLNFISVISIIFLFYIASTLIIIFVYDFKNYLIPDKILFPAIIITIVYRLFKSPTEISNYFLAVLIASGFFLVIFLVSRGRWMGFGDVKLAVLMGFLLGSSNVLTALFFAFFFGAIIGIILMIFGKKNLKSEIPFGPFLIAGTFIALFWGQAIMDWYTP